MEFQFRLPGVDFIVLCIDAFVYWSIWFKATPSPKLWIHIQTSLENPLPWNLDFAKLLSWQQISSFMRNMPSSDKHVPARIHIQVQDIYIINPGSRELSLCERAWLSQGHTVISWPVGTRTQVQVQHLFLTHNSFKLLSWDRESENREEVEHRKAAQERYIWKKQA